MDELHSRYQEYFDEISPILDYIKENWGEYREFMGWKDLNSPLIQNPQILFVGINPGPGRYRSWNNGKKWADHVLPPDLGTPWRSSIGWLTANNARAYPDGKDAMWWDKNARRHNLLPHTMCRLLCEIYEAERKTLSHEDLTKFFNEHVMVTNISPLVTEDLNSLKRLYHKLDKSSPWKDVESIFLEHTLRLVDLVHPSLVVYLGKYEKDLIHQEIKNRGIPTVTITRSFGWHSADNLRKTRDMILEKIAR